MAKMYEKKVKIEFNLAGIILLFLLLPLFASTAQTADKFFLDVPYYGQNLEWPWGGDFIGDSRALFSDNGCMVACASMVLQYYGVDQNPGILNQLLIEKEGYTEFTFREAYIGKISFDFSAPVRLFNQIASIKSFGWYDKPADIELIKKEIRNGHPVIAIVLFDKIYNHGVVIYGYDKEILYIHDPIDKENLTINDAYTSFNDAKGCCVDKNILGAVIYYDKKQQL